MTEALSSLFALLFAALLVTGAVRDLTSFKIPNWISIALTVGFVPAGFLAWTAGAGLGALSLNLAVGAAAFVAGVAMFAAGLFGGGDAKLLAAAGLWLGWPAAGTYVMVTGLAGGLLAGVLLALRSPQLRPLAGAAPGWIGRLAIPGESVPYGVAIAAGALAAFPLSPLARASHFF
jgi:prepilin peptidase CpaA